MSMGNPIRWIDFGKTYTQLRKELADAGESTVGIQIQLEKPLHRKNEPILIGDVDEFGDVTRERFLLLGYWTVLRYRRLLTAEELSQ